MKPKRSQLTDALGMTHRNRVAPERRFVMRKVMLVLALLTTALAATATTPFAAAESTVDEEPGVIRTEERNCFETLDSRPVLLEQAEAYVPDRYTVRSFAAPPPPAWTGPPDARIAQVSFTDYVCESVAVNGHEAQPTIVSLGTVLVTRDEAPVTVVLWVGTNNPLLFARLTQLGVNAYFVPHSSVSESTDALGRRVIDVVVGGGPPQGLHHSRSITVLSAPPGPTRTSTGTFYHLGDRGEVVFTYANTLLPNGSANISIDVDPNSIADAVYGLTSFVFPAPRNFFQGGWDGTIELVSP